MKLSLSLLSVLAIAGCAGNDHGNTLAAADASAAAAAAAPRSVHCTGSDNVDLKIDGDTAKISLRDIPFGGMAEQLRVGGVGNDVNAWQYRNLAFDLKLADCKFSPSYAEIFDCDTSAPLVATFAHDGTGATYQVTSKRSMVSVSRMTRVDARGAQDLVTTYWSFLVSLESDKNAASAYSHPFTFDMKCEAL